MTTKRDILVYIAGPFRAPSAWAIEQNVRRAEKLALYVWQDGFTAICPHANTRYFQGALPDDAWLEGDLTILSRCDAVLLVDDWRSSQGASAEVAYADKHGIPVFEFLNDLNQQWDEARTLRRGFVDLRKVVA